MKTRLKITIPCGEKSMRMIVVIVATAFVFMSCISFPANPERYARRTVHWDENLPTEQCVGLLIYDGLTVTSYNGIPVNWEKNTMLYLPPGTITLLMDAYYYASGHTAYSGKNWSFQWTFKERDRRYLVGWVRDEEPVILVINGEDKTKWFDQAAYKVPLQRGPTILQ